MDSVKEALAAYAMDDNSIKIFPPFFLTFKRMANEPGSLEPYCFSGEYRNQVLFLPIIMTHLYAGLKSRPPSAVAGEAGLVKMINYTAQHHCGPESGHNNTLAVHSAYVKEYALGSNSQHKVHDLRQDCQVIPASLFLVHMLNACIAQASVGTKTDLQSNKKRLNDMANLFKGALNTVQTTGNTMTNTKSHVWHFSKITYNISFPVYLSKRISNP